MGGLRSLDNSFLQKQRTKDHYSNHFTETQECQASLHKSVTIPASDRTTLHNTRYSMMYWGMSLKEMWVCLLTASKKSYRNPHKCEPVFSDLMSRERAKGSVLSCRTFYNVLNQTGLAEVISVVTSQENNLPLKLQQQN